MNGVSYQNINLESATGTFSGPDNRPRFPGSGLSGTALNEAIRINDNVTGAIFLTNQNVGTAYTLTASLEKKFSQGWFAKAAYNYGQAKNLVDPGSIAGGSYNGIVSVRGNNYPDLAFSRNDQRHRVLGALTYRAEYLNLGATQIGLFINGATQGRFSYVYNQDLNGDGINGNDLIYVPNSASEISFLPIVRSGTTLFTPAEQAAAYEAYIAQDEYLSGRRGQYAERNGGLFPWLWRADLSLTQEFFVETGNGKRNTLQLRLDMINFTNLINSDWGLANRVLNTRPLTYAGVTDEGVPQFRMATTGSGDTTRLLDETFQKTANFGSDTYSIQLGLRYTFN